MLSMAKIAFITGGAASGKTRWAVSCFEPYDNVLYMCVTENLNSEIAGRIDYNCKNRDIEWRVETGAHDLATLVKEHKFSILDNLGAYVNQIMNKGCPDITNAGGDINKGIEQHIVKDIVELIDTVKEMNGSLIIISTEFSCGPVPKDSDQRLFREIMGYVNQRIANMCSEVHMTVSGVTFKIKG